MPPARSHHRHRLLALSLAGGCTDAGIYLGLGHVFPANMTGNTVLLIVAAVEGRGAQTARSAVALGAFCAGVALGRLLIQPDGRWPARARVTFALEAAVLAALLAVWATVGSQPRRPLIAAAAIAMGAQSVAVTSAHVGGVTTTYITGTLTTAISRLADRARGVAAAGRADLPGESWLAYGAGALAGALLERGAGAAVVAVPLAAVLAGGLLGRGDELPGAGGSSSDHVTREG